MKTQSGKPVGVLAAALAALFAADFAHAYIPPTAYIVSSVAKKHEGFRNARIRSTLSALDGQGQATVRVRAVTWVDYPKSVVRSRVYDELGAELFVSERHFTDAEIPLPVALLLDRDATRVLAQLKGSSVAIRTNEDLLPMPDEETRRASEISVITRYQGTIAWVVGVDRHDSRAPQVWVQKDAFVPLRGILRSGGSFWEFRFDNYRYASEFPYPRMIAVADPSTDGKSAPWMREEVSELAVNLDAAELKNDFKGLGKPGWTTAGSDASSAVRDLVERAYRVLK